MQQKSRRRSKIKRKKKRQQQKKKNKLTKDGRQGDGERSHNEEEEGEQGHNDDEGEEGVTPEGWDVWVGYHDSFQMEAAISNKDNCICRLCNDWSRAA